MANANTQILSLARFAQQSQDDGGRDRIIAEDGTASSGGAQSSKKI
jgi:hypothetical protein